jgi:hypothetical protein
VSTDSAIVLQPIGGRTEGRRSSGIPWRREQPTRAIQE